MTVIDLDVYLKVTYAREEIDIVYQLLANQDDDDCEVVKCWLV